MFSAIYQPNKGTHWRCPPSLVLDHTKVTSFSGGGRVATTEYFMAIDAGTPRSHERALVQS